MLLLDGDDFYNRSDMFEMLSANIDKSGADVILFGCTDWNMKTGEMRISRSGYNLPLINEGQNRTDICIISSPKRNCLVVRPFQL